MGAKLANDVKVIPHLVQANPHSYEVNIGPLQAPDTIPKDLSWILSTGMAI